MTRPDGSLTDFLKDYGLRTTGQRKEILEYFYGKEGHLTPDELYIELRKKYPRLGRATVYRTLNLLKEAGLAEQIDCADGSRKFEHVHRKPHHDHMICLKCGSCIEFCSPKIEELQEEMAKKEGFEAKKHRLEIFGYCRKCARKGK
jgi:Fur family transcriptional regulator, ferric uptake regulator